MNEPIGLICEWHCSPIYREVEQPRMKLKTCPQSLHALFTNDIRGNIVFSLFLTTQAFSFFPLVALRFKAFFLPMLVTSGVFFSANRFPDVIQPIIKLLPLTALIESIRTVMLDGAGIAAVMGQIGMMVAWGLISFVIALRIFRWQ